MMVVTPDDDGFDDGKAIEHRENCPVIALVNAGMVASS
jgi:hypothetical protein